mgnify:CR=1 FL=1
MHILVVAAHAVDYAGVGDFYDAVCDGLGELVVVAGEDDIIFEGLHAVIERGDALEVEMVRRLVEQQEVCAGEHHAAEHAAHLFAAGEHLDGLVHIVAGEEHAAEEGAQIALALVLGELAHPVDEVKLAAVEVRAVVLGEVGGRDGCAPFDRAAVRLILAHEYLVQHSDGKLVLADEGDLVLLTDDEADVVQKLHAVHGLADIGDEKAILARLALGLEADPRVAAVRGGQLLDGDLVEQLAARGRLTGLGFVRREAGDEGLQLLNLLLGLLVLILYQLLDELAGLVPEVVVADVHLYLAVVDVDDVGADVVEKIAVVADDKDGALVVHQEVLQPDDACKV